MSRAIILVPARFGSTRFPGKPLAEIHGRPMISYVIENCRKSGLDFAIVTDNSNIESVVKAEGAQAIRIDDDVPSGSERIALAYQRYIKNQTYEFIINVQGDEPLLTAEAMQAIADFHAKNKQYSITTLVKSRSTTEEDYHNPNVVKCALSESDGKCLYFSRSSLPSNTTGQAQKWYQHIGIYCYIPAALEKFVELPQSRLEKIERLEQLRALENGMSIGATICNLNLIGVDTPEDIHKIEGALRV